MKVSSRAEPGLWMPSRREDIVNDKQSKRTSTNAEETRDRRELEMLWEEVRAADEADAGEEADLPEGVPLPEAPGFGRGDLLQAQRRCPMTTRGD